MNDTLLNRRDFLRAGTSAIALLTAGSWFAGLAGCTSSVAPPAIGFRSLRQSDVDLLLPLAPTILGPGLGNSKDGAVRALALLDGFLFASSDNVRHNLFKLYDLLQLGAARWWLTGFWPAPTELSGQERAEALASWSGKDSGFAKMAFRGLTQPIFMSWYANTDNACQVGYPGTPLKVVG